MAKHVFAYSMWRTGSTALARCFLENNAYLVFYEPFHELIRSEGRIRAESKKQLERTTKLSHPVWRGGYFDTYLRVDPLTGQTLSKLFDRSASVRTVYSDAPQQGALNYLDACRRVAEVEGKRAFFGFCRSGTQLKGIPLHDGEEAFYLRREVDTQMRSFGWPKNKYFIPQSFAQLAVSPNFSSNVQNVKGILPRSYCRLIKKFPRLGDAAWVSRRVVRNISVMEANSIFATAHSATASAAKSVGLETYTISELATHAKESFEKKFSVDISLLHPLD
ncbi:hypothetical protein N9V68_01755 [Octadecabacter sp.]|nr:hypothetical protein [Octadecabacter sp.]